MGTFKLRYTSFFTAILLAAHCHAGVEDKSAIVPPPEPSRWSVSAGVDVSTIRTSFHVDPGIIGLANTAGGSTSIYNGTAEVFYRNGGVVGLGGPAGFGPGSTYFANAASFTFDPNTFGGSATFLGGSAFPLGGASDTSSAVGPYIKFAYDAYDFSDPIHISPFIQYTFHTAYNSGSPAVGVDNVVTTYPATEDDSSNPLIIWNGALWGNSSLVTTQQGTVQYIFVNSGLNIDMHTFTFGIDFSKDLTDRIRLVLSTGPTLNLFYTDLSSSVLGLPIPVSLARSSGDTICFGWVGQAGVQVDLNASHTWFVEASGNYHWVTPFSVSTQFSSAHIDASSWGASLGLGHRF